MLRKRVISGPTVLIPFANCEIVTVETGPNGSVIDLQRVDNTKWRSVPRKTDVISEEHKLDMR